MDLVSIDHVSFIICSAAVTSAVFVLNEDTVAYTVVKLMLDVFIVSSGLMLLPCQIFVLSPS